MAITTADFVLIKKKFIHIIFKIYKNKIPISRYLLKIISIYDLKMLGYVRLGLVMLLSVLFFYDYWVCIWVMSIVYLRITLYLLYTHNTLKNLIIVKNQHTNTDNVIIIKFHKRSIHSNCWTNDAKRERKFLIVTHS